MRRSSRAIAVAVLPLLLGASDPNDLGSRLLDRPSHRLTEKDLTPAATRPTEAEQRPNYGMNLILGGVALGITTITLGTLLAVTSGSDPSSSCAIPSRSYAACTAQHDRQADQAAVEGALLSSLGSLAMTLMIVAGSMNLTMPDASAMVTRAPTPPSPTRWTLAPAVTPTSGGISLSARF